MLRTIKQVERRARSLARKHGVKKKDALAAIQVGLCIQSVDAVAFGKQETLRVAYERKSSGNSVVCFNHSDGKKPSYLVNLYRMEEVMSDQAEMSVHLYRSNGSRRNKPSKPDSLQTAIGTAVHEVRHRVQFQENAKIRLFQPKSAKSTYDPLLRKIIRHISKWRKRVKKSRRRFNRVPVKWLRRPTEFDAIVIAVYAVHLCKPTEMITAAQLRRILWMQPSA